MKKLASFEGIDPELALVLEGQDVLTDVLSPDTIEAARAASVRRASQRSLPGTGEPRRFSIDGPQAAIDLWFFAANSKAPAPCMLWFHGGGYVMGQGRDMWFGQFFSEKAGCHVLSVEYRLAPEHRAPAAIEDGLAALDWLRSNYETLGVDPARIAIGGASAGGGVAASVALLNRDRGGDPLALQLLLYPMLDRNHDTPSGRRKGQPIWWREQSEACWSMYLGDDVEPDVLRYAAAAEASVLNGLPKSRIFVGTVDLFHDDNRSFHDRLVAAGGESVFHSYPGMFHGGEVIGSETQVGRRMLADYIATVRTDLVCASGFNEE